MLSKDVRHEEIKSMAMVSGTGLVSGRHICCVGAISEGQVVAQAWILLLGGLGVAYTLDR